MAIDGRETHRRNHRVRSCLRNALDRAVVDHRSVYHRRLAATRNARGGPVVKQAHGTSYDHLAVAHGIPGESEPGRENDFWEEIKIALARQPVDVRSID